MHDQPPKSAFMENLVMVVPMLIRGLNVAIAYGLSDLYWGSWQIILFVIISSIPVVGWLFSYAVWIWSLCITPNPSAGFIVLFVLESLYFVYRTIKDAIERRNL